MGETNPRRLAVILEDLQQELTRWSSVAGDAMLSASYGQRLAREAVRRAQHHNALMTTQVDDDRQTVEDIQRKTAYALSQCQEGRQQAHATLEQAAQSAKLAAQALKHWQAELQYALDWLARAQERVRRAEIELAAAEAELRSARSELSSAESAYERCKNSYSTDSNGRRHYQDCSSERARVQRAQEAVRMAERRVELAQIELKAARAELARAQKRVEVCKQAVAYSEEAVRRAQEAGEYANLGFSNIERSLEHADCASRTTSYAAQNLLEEEGELIGMTSAVSQSTASEAEGQFRFSLAYKAEEVAQRLRILVNHELSSRIERLYDLDQPELFTSAAGSRNSTTGSGHSPAGGAPHLSGRWQARNATISTDDLPEPEGIAGEEDFRKVSFAEMAAGLERLQEMLPLINSGEGANADYWSERDRKLGLEHKDGYRRIYDAFYGQSAIRVSYSDGKYDIENGRHRIWLAKRQGIKTLPMRLIEPASKSRGSK